MSSVWPACNMSDATREEHVLLVVRKISVRRSRSLFIPEEQNERCGTWASPGNGVKVGWEKKERKESHTWNWIEGNRISDVCAMCAQLACPVLLRLLYCWAISLPSFSLSSPNRSWLQNPFSVCHEIAALIDDTSIHICSIYTTADFSSCSFTRTCFLAFTLFHQTLFTSRIGWRDRRDALEFFIEFLSPQNLSWHETPGIEMLSWWKFSSRDRFSFQRLLHSPVGGTRDLSSASSSSRFGGARIGK